jgi:hypothetical protein
MGRQPGDDYEVRYRLASRKTRRGSLALVATGLLGAAWLAATVTAPPRPETAHLDPTAPTGSNPRQSVDTGPTLPPSVERFAALSDTPIPVLSFGGLSWLKSRDGELRAPDGACSAVWVFMWADGSTLCVLHEPQQRVEPPPRVLQAFSPVGELTSTISLTELPAEPGERTETDVELDSANRLLYVASVRLNDDRWSVRLDRWSIDDGTHNGAAVAEGRDGNVRGRPIELRLWLSPEGRQARLRLALVGQFEPIADALGAWTWNVPIGGPEPGGMVLVEEPDLPDGTSCFAEGWATSDEFIAACRSPQLEGGDHIVVHSSALDGTSRQVDIGRIDEELNWILSATSGQLFLWAPHDHALWRVDVPSLDVRARTFQLHDPADSPWPITGTERVAWEPRGWRPRLLQRVLRPIVGSPDGTVVYTAGYRPARTGPASSESSGIWAVDAGSLAIVGHWDPVSTYNALAMTPGGDYVIALGAMHPNDVEAFGNLGPTMALHDARGGSFAVILRYVGAVETLLVPEPYPQPT